MLRTVTIERGGKRRDDDTVLDVLEALAAEKYGSAVNAAIRLIQQSPEFQETAQRIVSDRRQAKSRRRAC